MELFYKIGFFKSNLILIFPTIRYYTQREKILSLKRKSTDEIVLKQKQKNDFQDLSEKDQFNLTKTIGSNNLN